MFNSIIFYSVLVTIFGSIIFLTNYWKVVTDGRKGKQVSIYIYIYIYNIVSFSSMITFLVRLDYKRRKNCHSVKSYILYRILIRYTYICYFVPVSVCLSVTAWGCHSFWPIVIKFAEEFSQNVLEFHAWVWGSWRHTMRLIFLRSVSLIIGLS